MAFSAANFENELGHALASNSERLIFDKASLSSQVAGGMTSTWRATGLPGQGAIPVAAALCTKALTGCFNFPNAAGGQENVIAWAYYIAGTAGHAFEVHDRLAHMGGMSGTVTTAQTVNLDLATLAVPAERLGAADYGDCMFFLEWYGNTGATVVNATVNVTYDDLSTGNIVISVPGTTSISRLIPIVSAVAGRYIKGVNNVTLSATTGTAGNFGVTATRQRTALNNDVAGKGMTMSWAQLGIPQVDNNACLFGIIPVAATATGTMRGQMKLARA